MSTYDGSRSEQKQLGQVGPAACTNVVTAALVVLLYFGVLTSKFVEYYALGANVHGKIQKKKHNRKLRVDQHYGKGIIESMKSYNCPNLPGERLPMSSQ